MWIVLRCVQLCILPLYADFDSFQGQHTLSCFSGSLFVLILLLLSVSVLRILLALFKALPLVFDEPCLPVHGFQTGGSTCKCLVCQLLTPGWDSRNFPLSITTCHPCFSLVWLVSFDRSPNIYSGLKGYTTSPSSPSSQQKGLTPCSLETANKITCVLNLNESATPFLKSAFKLKKTTFSASFEDSHFLKCCHSAPWGLVRNPPLNWDGDSAWVIIHH